MAYSETTYRQITPAPNSRFAKAGGACFYESEVLNSIFVHLMKFSSENPRLRKAAKRCATFYENPALIETTQKMKIENLVCTIEISKMLKNAGYNKKAIFSYFKNKDGHVYISETDFDKDEFIAFAYTSTELGESLPAKLEIDNNTFVANFDNYTNVTSEEIEKFESAYLISMKEIFSDNETQYFLKYSLGERMIAFGQTLEGKYRNLFRSGNSEVESRAKMIIALIEEEKI